MFGQLVVTYVAVLTTAPLSLQFRCPGPSFQSQTRRIEPSHAEPDPGAAGGSDPECDYHYGSTELGKMFDRPNWQPTVPYGELMSLIDTACSPDLFNDVPGQARLILIADVPYVFLSF